MHTENVCRVSTLLRVANVPLWSGSRKCRQRGGACFGNVALTLAHVQNKQLRAENHNRHCCLIISFLGGKTMNSSKERSEK